ncbi:MAG: TM2 domain-containing protein [Gammaproteobacteria bacterium]|jgi:TM2 domain-containing membrane protein YozV
MSEAWKKLDLGGAGLQTLNAELTRRMKHSKAAYGLAVLFPLGIHRFYLGSVLGGLLYLLLSTATLIFWFGTHSPYAWLPFGAEVLLLIFDLFWIDRYVVKYNKALRVHQFLRSGTEPPKDYRGRYTDDNSELDAYIRQKERERGGHQPVGADSGPGESGDRPPSFNEQEAMLRELIRSNKGRKPGGKEDD